MKPPDGAQRPHLLGRIPVFGQVTWIGALSGITSGLLGVGGAIVLVPLLVRSMKLSQHRAHGTSLAVVIFTATAGAVGYARSGNVNVAVAVPLILGSVIGSPMGAHWASATPAAALRRAFGVLMIAVAVRFFIPHLPMDDLLPTTGGLAVAARVVLGWVTGVVSGFFGVGGGVILVPALVLLAGIPQHQAQGISLVFIVPTAIAGAWTHRKLGNVDAAVVLPLAVWSMLGAYVAALFATRLPAPTLRVLFGLFLVVMGLRMTLFSRRSRKAEAPLPAEENEPA